MRKLRVLQTIRQGKIGGGESHVLDLTEALDKSKFEPVVLSFTDGPMIRRLNEMGIQNHIIHTENPFDVRVWGKVKTFMQVEAIDLIHMHGTRANSNTFWAASKLGIPSLYTVHGWSFNESQSKWKWKLRTAGEKFLTRKVDHTISVSQCNQDAGKDAIPGFESRIINYGINLNRFSRQNVQKDVRKEFGISDNTLLVGCLMRMTHQKDPISMIKAFHLAMQGRTDDIKLLMVGDGELKPAMKELIEKLGLQDKIILAPFREDVPDVLAAFDIYCLPSLWEGLPIGLLEALAMGKAVVSTYVDGTQEIIQSGLNGLLVQPQNVKELAGALLKIFDNPELINQFEEEALKIITTRFEVSRMARQIENLYYEAYEQKFNLKRTWNREPTLELS